jgi:F-type H+-transporting ATPase subunit gamma
MIQRFMEGKLDAVYMVYNEFKSAIQQNVVVEKLLPLQRIEAEASHHYDYLYEPEPAELLDALLPRHVNVQLWAALLESNAAENGARMSAMDAATKNAGELIEKLTLQMNRIRQAAITKEIIEVVSGADALA